MEWCQVRWFQCPVRDCCCCGEVRLTTRSSQQPDVRTDGETESTSSHCLHRGTWSCGLAGLAAAAARRRPAGAAPWRVGRYTAHVAGACTRSWASACWKSRASSTSHGRRHVTLTRPIIARRPHPPAPLIPTTPRLVTILRRCHWKQHHQPMSIVAFYTSQALYHRIYKQNNHYEYHHFTIIRRRTPKTG